MGTAYLHSSFGEDYIDKYFLLIFSLHRPSEPELIVYMNAIYEECRVADQ